MKNNYIYALLAAIFAASFILNSFVLFLKPLHEEAYFSLHYTRHVQENALPLLKDELSYGGRSIEEPFTFYYLLAIFSSIHDAFIKIIPALLAASLVLVIFLIARLFIGNLLALIPALFAGFIPVAFKVNIITPSVLAFPILFLLIYSFTRIEEKWFLYLFVALSFILPLTSFLSIFYIFSILVYLFIIGIERKRLSELEGEALLFSLFVNIFLILFIFRNSFLSYGPSFVWQNTPFSILSEFFQEFTILSTVGNIGIAALLFGMVGFIFSFAEKRTIFLAAFLISSLIFLWLRLLPFNLGLIMLSLSLAALSSLSLKFFFPYLRETKFSKFRDKILTAIFILIVLTSVLPSVIAAIRFESKLSDESIQALNSLERRGSTILAPYEYGNAITFLGNNNVADSNFLLAPNAGKRLKDINLAYTSQSQTLVLEVMNKYSVKYIIFDDFVREKFGVDELSYVSDRKCFSKVYGENETEIYAIRC